MSRFRGAWLAGTTLSLAILLSPAHAIAQCKPGDANCDGTVNNFDIDAFVAGILYRTESDPPPEYSAMGFSADCWSHNACWGDVNEDRQFNNFDIDAFVTCLIDTHGTCTGLIRGENLLLSNEQTHGSYRVYIPFDYNAESDPVIVSLHGTYSSSQLEMGPHTRTDSAWPDCYDPTWPTLADDREHYRPFAIVCPDLLFDGAAGSTLCNLAKDEQHILSLLADLAERGEISWSNWSITGWSSGASEAIAIGFRNPDRFHNIVARYTYLDTIGELTYVLDTATNCLNTNTECMWDDENLAWVPTAGWYNTCHEIWPSWRNNESMRKQEVLIINNSIEPYGPLTEESIAAMALLDPPFTHIRQVVYPGGTDLYSCDVPLGSHEEARRVAAAEIAGW